jgi:voltage-gated potassium channel
VLKQKTVTSDTITMSISVYLLIGFTWGLSYIVLHHLQPLAFRVQGLTNQKLRERKGFPLLFYFSFCTLAFVGCNDIAPVSLPARYAAVAESMTGQFYLAILVARIVGMQMSNIGSHYRTVPENQVTAVDDPFTSDRVQRISQSPD